MKLTNRTTPQARNYQCDKCKVITCHKDMSDEKICWDCFDKICWDCFDKKQPISKGGKE
jgi:hypothetical protein